MYSKTAKAAMHEIPWNAKPTFSSAPVISETRYANKIDYFFLAARVLLFGGRFLSFGRFSVLLLVLLPREVRGSVVLVPGWCASLSLNFVLSPSPVVVYIPFVKNDQ